MVWVAPAKHGALMSAASFEEVEEALAEAPDDVLLEVSSPHSPNGDTLVVDPITSGISHIKSGSVNPLLSEFQAVASASRAEFETHQKNAAKRAAEVQDAVATWEPGALIDESTPEDGHCLFHACASGGLFTEADLGFRPTVFELRRMGKG